MRTVVGLFESGNEARRAIDEIAQLGFSPQKISVITNLSTKSAIENGDMSSGLQKMDLSDVGSVAASGPLTKLERPGERGGLASMLQRLGLSSELAAHYAEGVERGETLESLTVDDADAEHVAAVMKKHAAGGPRAPQAATKLQAAAAAGAVGQAVASKLEPERPGERRRDEHKFDEEERTIPVYREELSVGKREVERGGLRVTKHVVEKPYAEKVVLREEHIDVEHRPADRVMRPEESQFAEAQIEMAEIGEEAVGAKQTRLVEEIVIHKHVAERTATVGDTLRSTQVDIRPFDASSYRSYFDQQKLNDANFDEYVPAYRFGEGIGRPGSRWDDVEKDARSQWESTHPGTWDRFKDSIHYAWSRTDKEK